MQRASYCSLANLTTSIEREEEKQQNNLQFEVSLVRQLNSMLNWLLHFNKYSWSWELSMILFLYPWMHKFLPIASGNGIMVFAYINQPSLIIFYYLFTAQSHLLYHSINSFFFFQINNKILNNNVAEIKLQ